MAGSDQLYKLAARAKQAEENVAAARTKATAQLEADVEAARESAEKDSQALRAKVEEGKGKVSAAWDNAQRSFHENIASAKLKMHVRKAQLDAKIAEKDAERAADDAAFAIDFAYSAVEQAEYEVLDAILARKHADELASAMATRN
jgi:hypothetical protein